MSANNRRQPVRSSRTAAGRAFNYYQRASGNAANTTMEEDSAVTAPGFYPAVTHFTDGVAALPKEVMRYFTLLRETEGKAYQYEQAIGELVSQIGRLPEPAKATSDPRAALMAFSLSNSVNGSANVSVIDGHGPIGNAYQSDLEEPQVDVNFETRRRTFGGLRDRMREIMGVLDEKNMMLNSANETLSRQLLRLDNTMPYIEEEISEEARLGSKTHWALYDIQQMRRVTGTNERNKVDRQNANNLVAAAAAVAEAELSRSEARREAVQAKKRTQYAADSDFDERVPKKGAAGAKVRRVQEVAEMKGPHGTTAAAGQASKRRKVEKPVAPGLERTASTATNNGRVINSREAPNLETSKKNMKPLPAPVSRKRYVMGFLATGTILTHFRNAPQPPSLASSPTRGTFATTNGRDYSPAPAMARAASNRGRQNSGQALRPATAESRGASRNISSSHATSNGKGKTGTPGVLKTAADMTGRSVDAAKAGVTNEYNNTYGERTIEMADVDGAIMNSNDSGLKREDADGQDPEALGSVPMAITRSRTGARPPHHSRMQREDSSKLSPAVNAAGLLPSPEELAAPITSRSRSVRASASTTTLTDNAAIIGGAKMSSRGSVGREVSHEKSRQQNGAEEEEEGDNTLEADLDNTISPELPRTTTRPAPPIRTATTATSTLTSSPPPSSPVHPYPNHDPYATASTTTQLQAHARANDPTTSSPEPEDVEAEEDDENEPRYCTCGGVSYGDMIACDNSSCMREWFHLACVGLTRPPKGNAKWFCEECKVLLGMGSGAR